MVYGIFHTGNTFVIAAQALGEKAFKLKLFPSLLVMFTQMALHSEEHEIGRCV